MSDEADKEVQEGSPASVWSRGGEGPHELIAAKASMPEAVPIKTVFKTVDEIEAEEAAVAEKAAAQAPASAEAAESHHASEVLQNFFKPVPIPEEFEKIEPPKPAGPPTKNDLAIGYIIPLVLYFLGYIVNQMAGGYCLEGDKMNALADLVFYFTPALCACCLLLGSRNLKITGAVLVLPLIGAAFYAAQYFHTIERFADNGGPYGPLIEVKDENGWHICHYESSWTTGYQPGTTWTRQKDVGPGMRYVRKMRLGEPP